ncbi:hypothetical protein V1639_08920 [Pseudarthrobacter sp. J75]|uniref:hypothetical protein n=1 Tax=Pseudarthrobacter sp. J75 TaxID=3116486 RepID=UPI002E802ED5|nr:hypothetical protein [Pseudarthrobacter sp. J75]MEE2529150.1 hypothetical protein [Pseudarthrobacter sp. J75]
MSDNLEQALRRAVGLDLEQETEPPQPGQPVALNDFDSLKSIIMHEMKNGAALNAARKNHEDALKTIGDIAGNR